MTGSVRGFPLVLAAPSGVGKTTLARALVERSGSVAFSLSATTRPPRPGERAGDHYHFVDDAEFDRLQRTGELLEWATVHGYRYGTLRRSVDEALGRGFTVLLDIDVQGARRIRELFLDAVLVFVLPPSADELGRRLMDRASERPEETLVRMRTALAELEAIGEFDYVVVNDDLESAIGVLESILAAERHRNRRLDGVEDRVVELNQKLRGWIAGRSGA